MLACNVGRLEDGESLVPSRDRSTTSMPLCVADAARSALPKEIHLCDQHASKYQDRLQSLACPTEGCCNLVMTAATEDEEPARNLRLCEIGDHLLKGLRQARWLGGNDSTLVPDPVYCHWGFITGGHEHYEANTSGAPEPLSATAIALLEDRGLGNTPCLAKAAACYIAMGSNSHSRLILYIPAYSTMVLAPMGLFLSDRAPGVGDPFIRPGNKGLLGGDLTYSGYLPSRGELDDFLSGSLHPRQYVETLQHAGRGLPEPTTVFTAPRMTSSKMLGRRNVRRITGTFAAPDDNADSKSLRIHLHEQGSSRMAGPRRECKKRRRRRTERRTSRTPFPRHSSRMD